MRRLLVVMTATAALLTACSGGSNVATSTTTLPVPTEPPTTLSARQNESAACATVAELDRRLRGQTASAQDFGDMVNEAEGAARDAAAVDSGYTGLATNLNDLATGKASANVVATWQPVTDAMAQAPALTPGNIASPDGVRRINEGRLATVKITQMYSQVPAGLSSVLPGSQNDANHLALVSEYIYVRGVCANQ